MATVTTNDSTLLIEVPATAYTLEGFRKWVDSDNFSEKRKVSFLAGTIYVEAWWPPDEEIGIYIPPEAKTLLGFSDWTYSDRFPERGRITFIQGSLLIDMSPERFEAHVKIKEVLNRVLGSIVADNDLGEFYPEGGRLRNVEAGISNEPDAMLALWHTLELGRLKPPVERPAGTHTDLVGTPDWICEVVSDSSVEKDTVTLQEKYHESGIPEYWLIDARDEDEEIDFRLLVWKPDEYALADQEEGWQFSPVFRKWFKLTRSQGRLGRARYDLHLKD
jgi:Uma2 family endonuclease